MPIEAPPAVVAHAQEGAARGGYPDLWPLLVAIARYESRYHYQGPEATGDDGCSLGYLQFNTCGGLGVGHTAAELYDPVANMALGAGIIGDRLARGVPLRDALRDWTTRDLAIPLYYAFLGQLARADPAPALPPAAGAEPVPTNGGGPVPVSDDGPPPRSAVAVLLVALLALWLVSEL